MRGLTLLGRNDCTDADFARVDHLDVDGSFAQSFEHLLADAGVASQADAHHRELGNLAIVAEPGVRPGFQDFANQQQALVQVRTRYRKGCLLYTSPSPRDIS